MSIQKHLKLTYFFYLLALISSTFLISNNFFNISFENIVLAEFVLSLLLARYLHFIISRVKELEEQSNLTQDEVQFSPDKVESEEKYLGEGAVLLVEDNEINQMVAKGFLKGFGCEVDIVSNGQEAIELLSSQSTPKYSLILMDCHMPLMDGMEATKIIRSWQKEKIYKNIPIVAITADTTRGAKERCISYGMNDYISKPVQKEQLKSIVEKYLTFDNSANTLWDFQDALERFSNSEEVLRKILILFIEDTDKILQKLASDIESENFALIKAYAHTLKGSSSNVSALKIKDFAQLLEQAALENEMSSVNLFYKELSKIWQETLAEFEKYLQKSKKEERVSVSQNDFHHRLSDLKLLIAAGSYIDTGELDIFKVKLSQTIDRELKMLEKEINSFEFDKALVRVENILKGSV